jgi:hypothetical protein
VITVSIVEELAWKLERIGEELSWKIDRSADKVEEWKVFASIWLDDLPTLVQGWLQEQKLHFQKTVESVGSQIKEAGVWLIENAEKAVGSIRAKINEVGTWLNENAEKFALGVGVAGVTLGVAGLGPERVQGDVLQFYQGAVVVAQVDLRGRVAEYLEDVRGIDDLASKIMGDITQGRVPFSSQVDPDYGKKLDPKGGPEPW